MTTETHTPIAVPCEELELLLNHIGQGVDLPGDVVLAVERVKGRFPASWPNEPVLQTEPGNHTPQQPSEMEPNVINYVEAEELRPGDRIVVLTTIYKVTAITPYSLAYAETDKPVSTSNPPMHRWQALHILTNYGGLIRFGHEHVARLGCV